MTPVSILRSGIVIVSIAIILGQLILCVQTEMSTSSTTLIPNASLFPICPKRCTCSMTSSYVFTGLRLAPTVKCSNGIELSTPTFRISNKTEVVQMSGYPVDLLSLATVILRDCLSLRLLAVTGSRLQSLNGLAAPETLEALDLSHNLLSMLIDRAFIRVTSVRRLDLSYNRLESINHDAFYGLRDLIELDLSANRLGTNSDSVSSRWICCLPSVERLNLSRNGYHAIHDSFFDCRLSYGVHHLSTDVPTTQSPYVTSSPPVRDLDLGSNRIRYVTEHAFDGLGDIDELRLNDNAMIALPVSTIRRVMLDVGVSGLDLSGNEFDVIETGSFRDGGRLKRLRLSRLDRLKLVERNSFVNMTSLRTLDLSQCHRLRYVHRDAFETVPALASFNLSFGRLETLEQDVVRPLSGLRRLDIRSNPLICDCTTSWIKPAPTGNSSASSGNSLEISVDDLYCRTSLLTPSGDLVRRRQSSIATSAAYVRGQKLMKQERRRNDAEPPTLSAFTPRQTAPTPADRDSPTFDPMTMEQTDVKQSGKDDNKSSTKADLQLSATQSPTTGATSRSSDFTSCRPRILSLFDTDIQVEVTDTLRLDCIAVGQPKLITTWILPSAYDAFSSARASDVIEEGEQTTYEDENTTEMTQVLMLNGTLLIRAVAMHHHGNYTCMATVADGVGGSRVDERSVRVRVKSSNTGLIVLRMTSSTVTVTWRGLQSLREYRVRYHEKRRSSFDTKNSNSSNGETTPGVASGGGYDVIVKPYMRSFTASDLRPDTEYVFCIDIRQSPSAVAGGHVTIFPSASHHGLPPFVTVNCTIVTTRHRKFSDHLVRNRGVHILVLCVTAFVSASLVVVLATIITKRYDRRKRMQMALATSTAATSSLTLDTSQLQLTASGSMTSCIGSSLTFENRSAVLRQAEEEEEAPPDEWTTEQEDGEYVAMFDSDDMEEIRMTTSLQL